LFLKGTSISRLARENLAYKDKELNLFQLPIFEAFYLLSSNNLNITHEKYALHLLYRLTLNKVFILQYFVVSLTLVR